MEMRLEDVKKVSENRTMTSLSNKTIRQQSENIRQAKYCNIIILISGIFSDVKECNLFRLVWLGVHQNMGRLSKCNTLHKNKDPGYL